MKVCTVCEWRPVYCRDRCTACYQYLYRTGHDRSEELVVAHSRRVYEKAS